MHTNGYTTKGFSTKTQYEIEERIYLFKNGNNMPNITGYWGKQNYELYNGKTIMEGDLSPGPGGVLAINSLGNGSSTCVLLGTSVPVSLTSKRYLVVEAKVSDINAAQDFNVIVSRSKELSDDSSTIFYSFAFKTLDLKFYIDLSEITSLTKAYIAIAGGAMQNWRTGGTSLSVKSIYLTDIRYNSSILPFYNRGQDYNSPIERGDADYLIGWESAPSQYYEPMTLESDYVSLIPSFAKPAGVQTIRSLDINALTSLNILFEITEIVEEENNNHHIAIQLLNEQGEAIGVSTSYSYQSTGVQKVSLTRTYIANNIQSKNKVRVYARGLKVKIYAIWMQM